jgi:hypothetical protein
MPHPSELPVPLLQWPAVRLTVGIEETKSDGDNLQQPNWSYDAKTFLAR